MCKRLILWAFILSVAGSVAGGATLKINFQSNGSPIPDGYLPDYGDVFGDRGNDWSYGWNVDCRADARDRNSTSAKDQRYDTLLHFQKTAPDKIWEVALPQGTYQLFMVCGDPSNTDQTNTLDVEGTVVTDPDGQDNFDEYNVTVTVSDGRLTIKAASAGLNAKICFIDITSDVLTPFFVKAKKPDPADKALGVGFPLLQWTAGATAALHRVYFGKTPELGPADLVSPGQPLTMYYYPMPLDPGVTYYWRVDEVEADGVTVHQGSVWSFTSLSTVAWKARPADGQQNVLPDVRLNWEAGIGTVPLKHALYFGESFDEVNGRTVAVSKGTFEAPGYAPGTLQADTRYYWCVDEVEPTGKVRSGSVWSFMTVAAGPGKILREWWFDISGTAVASLTGSAKYRGEPDGWEFVSLMQNPPNWAEQYGVRLRGWLFIKETGNYIFTVAAVDEGQVRLSPDEDPAHAVTIANTAAQAQSQPQKLEAGKRYYIEALMKNETIDDNLTVSWQGPGIANQVVSADYVGATPFVSVRAYQADPAADAKDTRQSLVLTWKAGEKAKQHDVYFGADRDAVAKATTASAGIYQGRQALDVTTFDPGILEWGKTYFWRVDEVNPNDAESPWIGQVWSFTTANFLIVDDFESYTDHAGEEIWSTWIDGFADNFQSSGSTVGIDPAVNGTFGETSIVHSGKQSLPLSYDNSKAPFFSEARLDFAPLADWTVNGLTNLTLYFYGTTSNGTERLYVAVEDSAGKRAVVTNPAALTVPSWTEWKIPLSSLTGVNPAKVKKLSIGVGDRQAPAQGGTGRVYIDDVRVTKS
jgi:hypothetical protein